jgi:excisionase family DNA binding protein
MTIQEAAQCIGKSEATIRRWIKQGKLESTLTNGKYDIPEAALDAYTESTERLDNAYADEEADQETDQLHRQNEELLKQLSSQQERISKLEEQLENERTRYDGAAERHDMVVMQMTKQMGDQQKMLEQYQEPWYRKMFRRKKQEGDIQQ